MAISQVISTIPEAGHRGVDARDTFVTKQEAFQDALTDTFVTEINAFRTQANALASEVNDSADLILANYKGVWSSLTTYSVGENVAYNGFYWISNVNANLNNTPIEDAYWSKTGTIGGEFLPLSGGTMSGATYLTQIDKGTVSSGTVTFTVSSGEVQKLTVGGTLTIATTSWGVSGLFSQLLIELVNGGSATVNFPTIQWIKPDGSKTINVSDYLTAISRPALQTNGTDLIYFCSVDGGTTIYGKML